MTIRKFCSSLALAALLCVGIQPQFALAQKVTLGANQTVIGLQPAAIPKPGFDLCRAASVHVGDLTADDPNELYLAQRIEGDLTIYAPFAKSIRMPCLREVTGTLSVELKAGSDTSGNPLQSRFVAPYLTSVGGDVRVDVGRPDGIQHVDFVSYDVGLNALASVGGDLSLRAAINCAGLAGLSTLTSVRQLTIESKGFLYLNSGALLGAVTFVDSLILEGQVVNPLTALLSAGEVSIRDRGFDAVVWASWRDLPIGALYLVDVNVPGDALAQYFDLVAGAELVVFPGPLPTASDLCEFIDEEQTAGWMLNVVGFDPSSC